MTHLLRMQPHHFDDASILTTSTNYKADLSTKFEGMSKRASGENFPTGSSGSSGSGASSDPIQDYDIAQRQARWSAFSDRI